LRSILLAVTLLAIVFARIGYLRRMAEFHAREAEEYANLANGSFGPEYVAFVLSDAEKNGATYSMDDGKYRLGEDDPLLMTAHHRKLSKDFLNASYRPWMLVDVSMPKETFKYNATLKLDFKHWEYAPSPSSSPWPP
jgi:hypothetical protein